MSASIQNQALAALLVPCRDVLEIELAWLHGLPHVSALVRD
jgi:hypothetical protein